MTIRTFYMFKIKDYCKINVRILREIETDEGNLELKERLDVILNKSKSIGTS
jgi:hypothetical protein